MKNKGVTLIALIVTIVVLLILAGITIGTLIGENGLIGNSKEAKEQTEIANEKEALEQAVVKAMGENKRGNIEEEVLQRQLNKMAGSEKTEAIDVGEEFEVLFKESNRYYTVDKDGNVGDVQEIIKDKNPGDITKDKDGNIVDGSAGHPYEIWCIEDLVDFSNRVNVGENFDNKWVELARTLNFNSIISYSNYKTKQYGDLNQNGTTEELKTELTTGIGFTPIGNETYAYKGNFEGNNFEIRNLYVETEGRAGLFGKLSANNGTRVDIQNLTITGKVKSTQNMARRIIWDDRYI